MDDMRRLIILCMMRLGMVMVAFFVAKNSDVHLIDFIFSVLWLYTEYESKSIVYTFINKCITKVTKE